MPETEALPYPVWPVSHIGEPKRRLDIVLLLGATLVILPLSTLLADTDAHACFNAESRRGPVYRM